MTAPLPVRLKPGSLTRFALALGFAGALAACGGDKASPDAKSAVPKDAKSAVPKDAKSAVPKDAKSAVPVGAKPALTVTLARADIAEWPETIAANGNIAAWQEASVGAEVAGLRLAEVLVNIGDRVRAGQVLARLSAATVQTDLARERASIAESEATLADARANAERARALDKTGAISAQQIQQFLTAEQTAAARLSAARARLAVEQWRLDRTDVVAPDDGTVTQRPAMVGGVLQPGQELFRIIRKSRLEWRAEVTASELTRIRPRQQVRIEASSGARVVGTARTIAPTVDPQTRNAVVYVDVPASDAVKAGMFARGEFEIGATRATTLPQSAVLRREGFNYVFVAESASNPTRVRQTKVDVGRRQGDRIEITGGLPPDAQVAATGIGFLNDGDIVRVEPKAGG